MRFKKPHQNDCETIADAEHLLEEWRLMVTEDGALVIQPLGPCLSVDSVRELCDRFQETVDGAAVSEVVFDFGLVERITSPWTPAVALLIALARTLEPHCRVVALHGQPAAVIEILFGECELGLMAFEYDDHFESPQPQVGEDVIPKVA